MLRTQKLLVVFALGVAACSGTAEETVPVVTEPPTTTTVAPTTTTTALDPTLPLLEALQNPGFEAAGTITGTFEIDGTSIDFSGELEGANGEGRLFFDFDEPLDTVSEGILIGEQIFERDDDGPWMEGDPDDNDWLWNYLPDIEALSPSGTVTIGTETYDAYLPDEEIPLEAVGFYDLADFATERSVLFLADAEGVPTGFTVNLAGTRDDLSFAVDMDVLFTELFIDRLEVPDDYLYRYESDSNIEYSIGYPAGWTAEEDEVDPLDYFFFELYELDVYTYINPPDELSEWSDVEAAFIVDELGGEIVGTSIEEIGDYQWSMFGFNYDDEEFGPTFGAYAITYIDGGVMEVFFYAEAGNEAADAGLFEVLLSTVDVK